MMTCGDSWRMRRTASVADDAVSTRDVEATEELGELAHGLGLMMEHQGSKARHGSSIALRATIASPLDEVAVSRVPRDICGPSRIVAAERTTGQACQKR